MLMKAIIQDDIYLIVEKAIDYAFEEKKFLLKFYEYLKSTKTTGIQVKEFNESGTANELRQIIGELEGYIKGENHMDLSDLGIEAGIMAQNIIDRGLFKPLREVWGLEMPLYYPGLYAGASDVASSISSRESRQRRIEAPAARMCGSLRSMFAVRRDEY